MQSYAGRLKEKLEQEAGVVFEKIDSTQESEHSGWICRFQNESTIVAADKLLGKCVQLAAKELGE